MQQNKIQPEWPGKCQISVKSHQCAAMRQGSEQTCDEKSEIVLGFLIDLCLTEPLVTADV